MYHTNSKSHCRCSVLVRDFRLCVECRSICGKVGTENVEGRHVASCWTTTEETLKYVVRHEGRNELKSVQLADTVSRHGVLETGLMVEEKYISASRQLRDVLGGTTPANRSQHVYRIGVLEGVPWSCTSIAEHKQRQRLAARSGSNMQLYGGTGWRLVP